MTSSSRSASRVRRDREHGHATNKRQKQSRAKSLSKDNKRQDNSIRGRETKRPIQECECTPNKGRKIPPRVKHMHLISHEYTPFHHVSLDVMDGLSDEDEFGPDLGDGHEYIGDESTTILTPSNDTPGSTIPAYFDATADLASYFRPADIALDLQYVGHWVETQRAMNETKEMLPSYMHAMSLDRRHNSRMDVQEAMIEVELAFPDIENGGEEMYGTERR
ncbi:hypothetical protein EG329_007224 [Mollisiaceae sp. DMI_Dod_QoI]|nr:hypothetical protein EG329_007224 [Helotiales sp. DMI_Dod_QoI]